MSVADIQSQTISPAMFVQNEVSNTRYEPKEYSEHNSLDRIYVDPPVISRLNLEKVHSDMPEKIKPKETEDVQFKNRFEKTDFAVESKSFDSSNIKELDGDLKFAQANANQGRVEELLTSDK